MNKSQKVIKLVEDVGAGIGLMGAEDLPAGYEIKYIGQEEGWELRLNGEFVDKFPTERAAVNYACGRKEDKESGWEE